MYSLVWMQKSQSNVLITISQKILKVEMKNKFEQVSFLNDEAHASFEWREH